MEKKKGTLSTKLLVFAIILIGVMGVCMYMQKTESDRQIAELENSLNQIKETINEKEPSIKEEENELPNNEEVNELVTKFLELIHIREGGGFEGVLEKIGYDNYQEIYNNTVQSENNGDTIYGIYNNNIKKYVGGYSNTKIKYSDFEEKIFNYMDFNMFQQHFSQQFTEYNGLLYAKIGNASGNSFSNVTTELIYKKNEENVYLVKYLITDEFGTVECEQIISITNRNNKNRVTGFIQ